MSEMTAKRKRFPAKTKVEARDVRIVRDLEGRGACSTVIYDLATGDILIDVYRAVVLMDDEMHELTRMAPLPRDYEGPALLERADGWPPRSAKGMA